MASRRSWRRAVPLLLIAGPWLGCGSAEPPFAEYPLREALSARPDVIAGLSPEARARLRERFTSALQPLPGSAPGETVARSVAVAPEAIDSGPELLVRAVDAEREERGEDALLLVLFDPRSGRRFAPGAAAPAMALPRLAQPPENPTQELEEAVLAGVAAAPLSALLVESGAERIERVEQWPVAAAAIDGTVYVNAAWLVALSTASGLGSAGRPPPRVAAPPRTGRDGLPSSPGRGRRLETADDPPGGGGGAAAGQGWDEPLHRFCGGVCDACSRCSCNFGGWVR